MNNDYKKAAMVIKEGGVAVVPTDTIYGVVGSALNKQTVERIYKIKGRPPEKPFIILISRKEELELFSVEPIEILEEYWPGKNSIILPIKYGKKNAIAKKCLYLQRGTGTLAFRMPDKKELLELIQVTGPLVAPSANPSDLKPAKNITEAKAYFGKGVDYYLDGGELNGKPSTLIKIIGDKVEYLRK